MIVPVSPTYELVIPQEICESLGIQPGQKMQIMQYGNQIVCIPLRPLAEMRGFLKGIDTEVQRE